MMHQPEPRIAILVLGCLAPVYARCIRTIRATWAAKSVDGVDVFYVYGARNATREGEPELAERLGRALPQLPEGQVWSSGDIILCGAADSIYEQTSCILRKRLIAFRHLAQERHYDFVYTVCATSYVDVDGLRAHVRSLPASGVYHGPLSVHPSTGYPFVSGASILISRDVAADLAAAAERIIASHPEGLPDDVAIGHFLADRQGSLAETARRILGGALHATDNQTFVMLPGGGTSDFVMASELRQVPRERCYHYHFHSGRVWEMENFHRRFFGAAA